MSSSPVRFEDLAKVEKKFAATEVKLLRYQNELQASLFEDRADVVDGVPNFWCLVFEQAPPEIDQFISPSDSAALASLKSLRVTRFETVCDVASGTHLEGDPRSVSFTFEFVENDFFTDKVITKKFWYRTADDGWTGYVSEPTKIHWKEGKDLTHGMLDLAVRVWEREQARAQLPNGGADLGLVEEYDVLVKQVEKMNPGSVSFFAWFGYRGRDVTSEESARATKMEEESMEKGKSVVRESPAEHDAKGKEPTVEASKEEQSESSDESSDEYTSVKETQSEDEDVSADDKASEAEDGAASEDEDGAASEDEDEAASEDAPVSDISYTLTSYMAREIFPAGEDLAIALSEDLYPCAIKYFIEAHTQASTPASEPSEVNYVPGVTAGQFVDPPDLEDSALMRMIKDDDQRAAKKRKRV